MICTVVILFFGPALPLESSASECAVTVPSDAPVETGNSEVKTHDWYGSETLAALIPRNGHWVGMGPDYDYRDKFWWWREGFSRQVPKFDLKVTATRLDAEAPVVTINDATAGWNETWNAMLVGMEFPTAGCWEVTGTYDGNTNLTIVLLVGKQGR